MLKIGWDISHMEFTINDHYYYSKLKNAIIQAGFHVDEITRLRDARNYNVIVFNYPEKPFSFFESRILLKFLRMGKRIIMLGYYNNEDGVADAINSFVKKFGIYVLHDSVWDETNNYEGDKLLVITSKIKRYNWGVKSVMMPCSASIRIIDSKAEPVLIGEKTSKTTSGNAPIMMVRIKFSKGELIVGGSCSFWDNFSIDIADNLKFALNLLAGHDVPLPDAFR